jgi:hypothetical protein
MGAIVPLAIEIIPLLVKAGMDLAPTVTALFNANESNVEETKALLHQQRAAALKIINDTSRDVR